MTWELVDLLGRCTKMLRVPETKRMIIPLSPLWAAQSTASGISTYMILPDSRIQSGTVRVAPPSRPPTDLMITVDGDSIKGLSVKMWKFGKAGESCTCPLTSEAASFIAEFACSRASLESAKVTHSTTRWLRASITNLKVPYLPWFEDPARKNHIVPPHYIWRVEILLNFRCLVIRLRAFTGQLKRRKWTI